MSFSCQYSEGVKIDMATGLSTSYNGLTIDDIYLADENGNRLGDNKIIMGSKLAIVATGVDYFMEKDGKVFPGCNILLTDKTGEEILNLPDAFAEMVNGTTASEAKILQASLNTGDPMIVGETYHLYVRFYDKNKKENEIMANVDLLMKE
ncbi:MAG: hypothetical protein CVU08_02865 [Bacteroidetes bacterium HGW-Bacteroidetes-3]|jgi:hypothetical protein|nr:MAG: hypothetical protein CVU08_02865 [Bacteroidetes bacterium HGW-Bacteroidetes-3]